jgi:putative radical SAM enzyme (TIGR03279 family)
MSGGIVTAIEPGSIADVLGLRPGDVLLQINGHPLRDVLDVQFYAAEEQLALLVRRGEQEILYRAERQYAVPLGLDFATPTFDGLRRCRNRCEFCFVAQMPPGLRRSLYVRDDDYRYSVLYGSFITLTNLTPDDWDRLEEQRLSPLYVSVHATDRDLRRELLNGGDIPDILEQLDRLAGWGIQIHAQIVLVPGVNDGPALLGSVRDLVDRYPAVQSIGIVPVGLTRHHRARCRGYTPGEARPLIDQIAPLQEEYRARFGTSLVYLADEWYLLAGTSVPADETYDEYPQIENGIGLVRQLLEDAHRIEARSSRAVVSHCTLACGTLVGPTMKQVASRLAAVSGVAIDVAPISNRLFGEQVTVSGLLGGEDVIAALQGQDLGDLAILPGAMFSERPSESEAQPLRPAQKNVAAQTLDGLTVSDLAERLSCPVVTAHWMSEVWDTLSGT